MTPWLQLYVALRRTQAEKNKYILEEPVVSFYVHTYIQRTKNLYNASFL